MGRASAPSSGAPAAAAHSASTGFAVAVAYAAMSLTLALLNKLLLSSYAFPCFFVLLATQLAVSLAFCIVSRDLLGNPFGIERLNADTLWLAAPMAVAYVLNVTVGMAGLQLVNVPMFFAIRRLVPACVVAYEWAALSRRPDGDVRLAVGVIAVGAVAAGWETFSDDRLGYSLTMANNVITAYMFVMQKAFSQATGLSTFSVVLYNAAIALPLTAAMGLAVGEGGKLLAFAHLGDPRFAASLLLSAGMGLALTYTSVLCTTYNSPLATSITGNVKDIFTTTLGWLLFGGFKSTRLSLGGLLVSFVGAGMYSWTSLRKSQRQQHAAAAVGGGSGGGGGGAGGAAAAPSPPAAAAAGVAAVLPARAQPGSEAGSSGGGGGVNTSSGGGGNGNSGPRDIEAPSVAAAAPPPWQQQGPGARPPAQRAMPTRGLRGRLSSSAGEGGTGDR